MSRVSLDQPLREEYRERFRSCVIDPGRIPAVDAIVAAMEADRFRYQRVGDGLGIPWFVVAILHYLESRRDFSVHLHNGDPLTARTFTEPAGRPLAGEPPFSWEASAVDALQQRLLHRWSDWSLEGVLFKLEAYHGWHYRLRQPAVASPYLWSFSNHYQRGKFVTTDIWNDNAVVDYCGGGVLLRRLAELDRVQPEGPAPAQPLIRLREAGKDPWTEELQRFLNHLPGIFVRIDGQPGARTSAALQRALGCRLQGDAELLGREQPTDERGDSIADDDQ